MVLKVPPFHILIPKNSVPLLVAKVSNLYQISPTTNNFQKGC